MEIIGASVVFVCDEECSIIYDGGVAMQNGKIIAIGKYSELESALESNLARYVAQNPKNTKHKTHSADFTKDLIEDFALDFVVDFDSKSTKTKNQSKQESNHATKQKSTLKSSPKSTKPPHIKKQFFSDCVLLPALVNAHIHFEFGANTTSFAYGSFEAWLESVMSYRGGVLEKLENVLTRQIATQLECGVGSVGAISSYGGDMLALAHSPLRVAYFCEVLGANAGQVNEIYATFEERFLRACEIQKNLKNERFYPRVAIHSPYSVHKELAKNAIDLAKKYTTPSQTANKTSQNPKQSPKRKPIISAHFLESASEREWLESKSGWFKHFYADTLKIPNPKPLYSISEFLDLFSDTQAVLTHCVAVNEKELVEILQSGHFITTCPRSNRLLGGKMLDIGKFVSKDFANADFEKMDFNTAHFKTKFLSRLAIGTDGSSSNVNTNLLDEMRVALFGLNAAGFGIEWLAKHILLSATRYGAQALGLENGELKRGKNADFAIFHIPQIAHSATPILHFFTNATKAHRLYINGEVVVKS
ncbi:aminofutalosine deaminase family hydrolase [Helicobacter sp. T3_23-1059]